VSGEFCALLCELRRLSGPLAGHRVHSRIVPRRSDVATRNAVRRVAIEVEGHSEYARINVSVVVSLLHSLRFLVRSRAALHLEILALRHQLAVTTRSRRPRLRLTTVDRVLWVLLSRRWRAWRSALHIVQPATVLAWHRRGFRLFWTWKSRHRTGRPGVPRDVRALIREMSTANPLWGAPRIHGELQKLGISVSQSSVAKLWLLKRSNELSRLRLQACPIASFRGVRLRLDVIYTTSVVNACLKRLGNSKPSTLTLTVVVFDAHALEIVTGLVVVPIQ
jgi:hypothetical protein